jgi:hypothetical protein
LGQLDQKSSAPNNFFWFKKIDDFILKNYYGFRFLGFSGFLGFCFSCVFVVTPNLVLKLPLCGHYERDLPSCALFYFLSCSAFVFSKLFVSAAFYLSIFLLDQQIFEFSRIVLFLQLKNKFCYSFYCLFQASNSGRDCKLGVFVLSLHRIS